MSRYGPVTIAGSEQLRLEASDEEQAGLDTEWTREHEEEHEECEKQGEEQLQGEEGESETQEGEAHNCRLWSISLQILALLYFNLYALCSLS